MNKMSEFCKDEASLKHWAELVWNYVYRNTRRGRQLPKVVAADVKTQLAEIEEARRKLGGEPRTVGDCK